MKRLILILCIAFISDRVGYAPEYKTLIIEQVKPINPYEAIWEAVCKTESSGRAYVINKKELAYGIAQIRISKLKDYNRLTKNNYTLIDCLDPDKSKKIFMFFSGRYNPNEYRAIARDWNKSKTEKYWNKVKINLVD